MDGEAEFSHRLAGKLQQAGLAELAAAVLEAGAPLAPFAAQLTYVVEPLLGSARGEAVRLARLLDNPRRLTELVGSLREGQD